jgi:hypothetical protein
VPTVDARQTVAPPAPRQEAAIDVEATDWQVER